LPRLLPRGIVRAAMPLPAATLLAAIAALALSSCATPDASTSSPSSGGAEATRKVLNGSIVYREKAELPADARIRVQLLDAPPGKPATVLAETEFGSSGRQVPVPFALPVDTAKLKGGHGYALRAYIAFGGQTRYVTAARVNVDPDAIPATVSILVQPGAEDPQVTDSPAPPGAARPPRPPTARQPVPGRQPPGRAAPAPR
jgi:putative lipoprotein